MAIFYENRRKSTFSKKMSIFAAFSAKMPIFDENYVFVENTRSLRSLAPRTAGVYGSERAAHACCTRPRAHYVRPRVFGKICTILPKTAIFCENRDFQRNLGDFAENTLAAPRHVRFAHMPLCRSRARASCTRLASSPTARHCRQSIVRISTSTGATTDSSASVEARAKRAPSTCGTVVVSTSSSPSKRAQSARPRRATCALRAHLARYARSHFGEIWTISPKWRFSTKIAIFDENLRFSSKIRQNLRF